MQRPPLRSTLCQVFLLFLPGILPVEAFAQAPGSVHGLWIWKTSTVLAVPGRTEALRTFCRSQQINEVYVSFSRKGGASDRAEDALLVNVIRVLHKSNIRVEALLSSTDADEPGKHREKLLGHFRDVLQFNQHHPNEAFDGVHLDIEPQQRPENKGPGNLNFLPNLVETYRAARDMAASAHITINADIQNKLLKGDLSQRRSLLFSLPRLTLMLYELSSPEDGQSPKQEAEKLRSASEKFVAMAFQGLDDPGLAKIAIGLRTPDYEDLLPSMFRTVDDALRGNPHYLGWAWHSWNDTKGSGAGSHAE
jgi:hypothetical protein